MEWEVTETDFKVEPKDKTKVPKLKLDNEVLRKYLLPAYNPKKHIEYSSTLEIQIPILPNIGARPKEPKKPDYPNVDEVISPYLKPFTSKRFRTKKTDKEYEKRLNIYKRRYDRFEKKLALHERRAIQYGIDLSQYDLEVTTLYNKFDSLLVEIEKEKDLFIKAYNVSRWNASIKHYISLNEKDELEYYNARAYLKNISRRYVQGDHVTYIEHIMVKEEFVKSLKLKTYPMIKSLSEDGIITYDAANSKNREKYSTIILNKSQNLSNNIAESLCETSELVTMFNNAEKVKLDKMKELGLATPNEVNSVYTASINNMGYVNCDRFSNVPQELMTRIDLKKEEGEDVTLILTDINSILRPFRDDKGEYLNLPITQKVKMVVVGLKAGIPTYEERTFTANEGTRITTNAKEINLESLKNSLLNI